MPNFGLMWKFEELPDYGAQNILVVFVLSSNLNRLLKGQAFRRFSIHAMNSRGGIYCENPLYH
jgi:hypothetical protein